MASSSRGGRVPRRILIAVVAAAIPLLAGCEAGTNAPSLEWHQPTDGTGMTVGNITISNAFVLGAPIGKVLHAGQNASMFLGLTNIGTPDILTGISAPGVAGSVTVHGGKVVLGTNHSVLLTGPRPALILHDLIHPVTGGSVVTIFLRFAKAGVVELHVPVMPQATYFDTLSQAPSPKPTPTGAKAAGKSATPTPSPSSS